MIFSFARILRTLGGYGVVVYLPQYFKLVRRLIRESEIYWNHMHEACTVFQKEGVMVEMCNAVLIEGRHVDGDRQLSDDVSFLVLRCPLKGC